MILYTILLAIAFFLVFPFTISRSLFARTRPYPRHYPNPLDPTSATACAARPVCYGILLYRLPHLLYSPALPPSLLYHARFI